MDNKFTFFVANDKIDKHGEIMPEQLLKDIAENTNTDNLLAFRNFDQSQPPIGRVSKLFVKDKNLMADIEIKDKEYLKAIEKTSITLIAAMQGKIMKSEKTKINNETCHEIKKASVSSLSLIPASQCVYERD
jgi:hypothetical protein